MSTNAPPQYFQTFGKLIHKEVGSDRVEIVGVLLPISLFHFQFFIHTRRGFEIKVFLRQVFQNTFI